MTARPYPQKPWPDFIRALPGERRVGEPQQWWVYVCEDANGDAVYVGCTDNPRRRAKMHSVKPWFVTVTHISLYGGWPDRSDALECEREMIRELDPPHNIHHTDRHARPLTVAEAQERLRVAELALTKAREALAAAEHRALLGGAA